MAQYIGVKQVTLTKPTIAQILEVEHEWQNDNPHADIRDLDLRIVGGSANERLVKVGHSHQPITGPQRSTERQLGTTPATSGRAELTPALGPVQSPPVPETAESLAAPLRPAPSPAAATPRSCQLLNSCPTKVAKNWRRKRGQNGPTTPTASDVGTLAKKAGSNKAQSPPCLASAAEVRKLTPNAWPKWTYGPNGEQCWYSGEKPVFAKTR